ncbi:hypothetical protein [Salinicola sp. CR57]|uniref:hypothetical protein n=1 Tax=Salinicola sp. CR57 TaxID=1949086 RepID=UPI0013007393|nr:hypothetical protein [Salinicola sp. CR57]
MKSISLICATKVLPKTALTLIHSVFLFAWATQNGDNLGTGSKLTLLVDSIFIAFMVAFHGKRSFPARKSVISPGDAYRAVFLSPLPPKYAALGP